MEVLNKIQTKIISKTAYFYYIVLSSLKSIYHRDDFKDIRTMVLTIGFNASGSSLAGHLLTAHPNIVIADELHDHFRKSEYRSIWGCLVRIYQGNLNNLFQIILDIDRLRYQTKISTTSKRNKAKRKVRKVRIVRGRNRKKRYILVPNQYQGRFERLKVIGVKSSVENTSALLEDSTLASLRRKLKEGDIKLKFLFTIRNPYDITARILIMNSYTAGETAQVFENHCESLEELLKRIDPQNIFVHRHEDICKDPRQQLARLCDFLEVPIPDGYIEDCASQVVQDLYKSRLDINWSPQLKQTVAWMIEKHDFFSGYDWET